MKSDFGQAVSVAAKLGVIPGLLFLGYELRQNTLIFRGAAVQAIAEQVNDWQIEMASNPDWIRILAFLEDGGTYAELSAEDRLRYRYVVTPTVRIMEIRHQQVQLGIIDESALDVGGGRANQSWYRSAHFEAFWEDSDVDIRWSPEFIEFMETQVMAIRQVRPTEYQPRTSPRAAINVSISATLL